jgi:hypothetical protein
MKRLALAFAGALAATTGLAQAPIVTTVYNSGTTQSRYDMVILGDGYQAFEQTRFNQDVTTFLTALFQRQPYSTFAAYYNVHTVFRASVDSGADHPDATPPIYKNTVYDATYNTGGTARCLYIQNTAQALADAALAPANEGRVLVFVNDSRYGGCASTFAVSYNGSSMTEVQIHELGHSLGGLADEYDYPNQTYTGSEPGEVNATTSPTGQKWSHWWGTGGISAFQGAKYYLYGLYRPKSNCLMRSLGVSLCAVCQEQISKLVSSIVDSIPSHVPTGTNVTVNVGQTQTFTITHIVPTTNNPLITWKVDGSIVPGANAAAFVFDPTGLPLGAHTVAATVQDQTALVRLDPTGQMIETQTWQVTVLDPTAAQLRLTTFQSSQIWVTPGAPITFTTTAINDGPAAAGAFDVEFFLTTTPTWSPSGIYLGKETVNGLSMGQQAVLTHPVQVPWRLEPRLYYLFAVADRADAVRESIEGDNVRNYALIGQNGPCVTKLEYDDALVYPGDAATLSLAAGGASHPTVVARCASPNTLYLIVWGCSGTAPGTTIAPGLTVPINQDFCTQLGLSATNGPWFQSFFGVLDPQGLGRATFALPPASGLGALQGHFAALLVDPVLGFSDVSNPVAITLQ